MDLQNQTSTGLHLQGGQNYSMPGSNLTGTRGELVRIVRYIAGRVWGVNQPKILSAVRPSTTALSLTTVITEPPPTGNSIIGINPSLSRAPILMQIAVFIVAMWFLHVAYTEMPGRYSNSREAKRKKTYRRVIIALIASVSFGLTTFVNIPVLEGELDKILEGLLKHILAYSVVIWGLALVTCGITLIYEHA